MLQVIGGSLTPHSFDADILVQPVVEKKLGRLSEFPYGKLGKTHFTYVLSYIFISHDLAVIKVMADYVMVMKNGRIIEEGVTQEIFESPKQDYTKSLITSSFNLKELLSEV